MNLQGRVKVFEGQPFVCRIETSPAGRDEGQRRCCLLTRNAAEDNRLASATLALGSASRPSIELPEALSYLGEGDIIRITPRAGRIDVLYRKASQHNVLFVTERCNSRCIMCSQPPRDIDDSYLITDILETIALMDPGTKHLGITGGEPTLAFDRLLDIVQAVKTHLPDVALHMLTNGRLFCYLQYAARLAQIGHRDLMLGIPLYSDIASHHNYVVQAQGAFDETVLGIANLDRVGVKVEIRFVIHRETVKRLPQTARYIARNFPFASQVALMGLELMGFARTNLEAVWIDPYEYQDALAQAVETLRLAGLKSVIYNLPLCLLKPEIRGFARRSISDWKNTFVPACDGCSQKEACCGFFSSAQLRMSPRVRPIGESSVEATC